MVKPKLSAADKLRKYVKSYPREFSHDGSILFCKICECTVSFDRSCHVSQHRSTKSHSGRLSALPQSSHQQQSLLNGVNVDFSDSDDDDDQEVGASKRRRPLSKDERLEFNEDLAEFFIANDIPLCKLNNDLSVRFIRKWVGVKPCDESTLRKVYLPKLYNARLDRIRKEVGGRSIWVSIDETTDLLGRKIGAVVIGSLDSATYSKPYLNHIKELDKVNNVTIAQLFQDAMLILWPTGIKYNRVRLFVTDGVPYMCAAGRVLKGTFSNMLHVTCIVHALHLVADKIRLQFSLANDLIANGKAVFLKAPNRVDTFREQPPGIELPPEPVLTRWGTWLRAANYYAMNIVPFAELMDLFREDDAESIQKVKEIAKSADLSAQLACIQANYEFLPHVIERMEAQGLKVAKMIEMLDHAGARLRDVDGTVGEVVHSKFQTVIAENPDLTILRAISKVLSNRELTDREKTSIATYSPSDLALYCFAPLTSVDVERSFSRYKNVLRSNRTNFTVEHLRWHLIAYCNT